MVMYAQLELGSQVLPHPLIVRIQLPPVLLLQHFLYGNSSYNDIKIILSELFKSKQLEFQAKEHL